LYGSRKRNNAFVGAFVGSRPSDHFFRSVFWFVCLSVCLCRVFSAVFDPISTRLGHNVTCLGLVVSPRIYGLCDPWGLRVP